MQLQKAIPPPIVAPSIPPSDVVNISGISMTNSASATQCMALSFQQLGSVELASILMSVTQDPKFDDLVLTQFYIVNVVHGPSIHDDDPYDLDVNLGDVEVSFTKMT